MVSYLRELVEAKRAAPAADLLSALVAVRDGGDRLSEDELTSMAFALLLGGYETTVNLLGNGALALLTRPSSWRSSTAAGSVTGRSGGAAARRHPGAGGDLLLDRRAGGDRRGHIPAGEIVVPGLLAANRDLACIAQPDALDITRTDTPHLTFSHGIHHCLGAPLARLEGRIALGTLLARFPRLRLAVPAEQLTWRPSVLMNGLAALPVTMH